MRWLQNNEPWVRVHVDTRFGPGPHSVSPVEEILGEVQRRIGDRAGTFANQARMNRLLKLIALDLNGDADELAWAEIIRRHLITNGGRPGDQRQADDPKGYRSLRA
jgi:hypothetical protein